MLNGKGCPDKTILRLLKIFNRMEQIKQLPYSGGIMQQPEKLMACMDVIRQTHDKWAERKTDRERDIGKMKKDLRKKYGR